MNVYSEQDTSNTLSCELTNRRLLRELAAQEWRLVRAAAVHTIDGGGDGRAPAAGQGLPPAALAAAAQLPLQRLLQRAAVVGLGCCGVECIAQLLVVQLKI